MSGVVAIAVAIEAVGIMIAIVVVIRGGVEKSGARILLAILLEILGPILGGLVFRPDIVDAGIAGEFAAGQVAPWRLVADRGVAKRLPAAAAAHHAAEAVEQ